MIGCVCWGWGSYLSDARTNPAAGVLGADAGRLSNQVIVAGGQCSTPPSPQILDTAEVWDPARDLWEHLPPMRHARAGARGFALPFGRFAVVGGMGVCEDGAGGTKMRRDTEIYDVKMNAWSRLSDECANCRSKCRVEPRDTAWLPAASSVSFITLRFWL
jgi:hypothetical protein